MASSGDNKSKATPDKPGVAEVIERNIEIIERERAKREAERSGTEVLMDTITGFSGSIAFLYIHLVWFGIWIVLNSPLSGSKPFDPFPYGLLTMIVSLEAIFLSTIVLISQNRMSELSERRNDLALQISLLTEYEVTRSLKMLHAIHEHMHVLCDLDPDEVELEMETRPEDVLAEIKRLHELGRKLGRPNLTD